MKFLKPTFTVAVLFILAQGCKKTDFSSELSEEATEVVATPVASQSTNTEADSTGWSSAGEWKSVNQEDFSVYYININDNAITADVVDNGLVLVYKKTGGSVVALPVEEGAKEQSQYWYHQVTEGSILISVDAYGTPAPDASNAFKYFVVTPAQIKQLEAKGVSAAQLMDLSYDEAARLLSVN